jgi:hypothetical protein
LSTKIKEGNSDENEDDNEDENEDKCEYILRVSGMISEIDRPELYLFGMNILEPISAIVDMINEIINIINKIIIAIDFFINKFIKCLLFYILDGTGKGIWGIIILLLKLIKKIINIDLESYLYEAYTFLDDTIDANLYKFAGIHVMHFPTIIQNRCYHVFGDGRIPCWKSPFDSSNKEGAIGVSDNSAQNTAFFILLCKILGGLFVCLLIYIIIGKIMSKFKPTVQCEGPSCK